MRLAYTCAKFSGNHFVSTQPTGYRRLLQPGAHHWVHEQDDVSVGMSPTLLQLFMAGW